MQLNDLSRSHSFWSVGARRFPNLKEVGEAYKDGSLTFEQDGGFVDSVGINHAEAARLSRAAKIGAGITLAGAGLTAGLTAAGFPGAAVVSFLTTGMTAAATCAIWKDAREFETQPRILESGCFSVSDVNARPALLYRKVFPIHTTPSVFIDL